MTLQPWVAFTFFAAGLVKGVVGMGLPTMAMGMLALVMTPLEAAALLVMPSLATNLWQMVGGPSLGEVTRRLWLMMLCVCAGTALGISLMTGVDSRLPAITLGVALLVYGLVALLLPPLSVPRAAEPWASPVVGLTTGVLSGATGIFVLPAVPYVAALGFGRAALIQALGLSFTVSTVALAAALYWTGNYTSGRALQSLVAVLPAVSGMWAGQALCRHLNADTFKRCFLWSLMVIGAYMIISKW
jgi:hypothetical protein